MFVLFHSPDWKKKGRKTLSTAQAPVRETRKGVYSPSEPLVRSLLALLALSPQRAGSELQVWSPLNTAGIWLYFLNLQFSPFSKTNKQTNECTLNNINVVTKTEIAQEMQNYGNYG